MISAVELRAVLGADESLQARVKFDPRGGRSAHQALWRGTRRSRSETRPWCSWGAGSIRRPRNRDPCFRLTAKAARQRVPRVSVERRARAVDALARPARGRNGAAVRWPWQRPIVEHRSYTDAVVTAILQSASGGSVRTALATAAVESCATLYAVRCHPVRCRGRRLSRGRSQPDWRASVASGLVRNGQALYLIDADPSAGLALVPVSSLGCARRAGRGELVLSLRAGGAVDNRLAHAERWRGAASPLAGQQCAGRGRV